MQMEQLGQPTSLPKGGGTLLGNVQRMDGTVKVAWRHDALDEIPAHERLPMQRKMLTGI